MNTSNLKKYAPKARRAFIEAVSKRANLFGIHKNSIAAAKVTGGVMDIEGKTFDAGLLQARERLAKRVDAAGFDQLMEQMAYTWFNRLCAIRYMELQGYLDHGLRVLSSPVTDNGFEILEHAQDVADDLGLSRELVVELKLAGNKDEELYRELLVGQCHKLHEAMPFLFEALDDETELLLPDNLTRTDSLIRALVDDVPEEDWQQVEVIGWLYQFYISEKKEAVIGKVVKSEDIPAATQLFTPKWIVQYIVHNSLGAQWMTTYPESPLKRQMEYYIEPAEQSDAVNAQLAAITPDSIEPESIKVLDPACGSGHILVEAYNVLRAIYEERGYRSRDIPKLILENNLFGIDIDDRAAQLAGFTLMMMAREDDRRIFTRGVKLNVLSLQETKHVDLPVLWKALNLSGDWNRGTSENLFDNAQQDLSSYAVDKRFQLLHELVRLFDEAKTFGSLIQVPTEYKASLEILLNELSQLVGQGDSMQKGAALRLLPYVKQAWVLAQRYDAVVANPPYMGGKGMNASVKKFVKDFFPNAKSDLFACFIERGYSLAKHSGHNSMVTMESWMFLSSYEIFRDIVLQRHTLRNLAHFPYDGKKPTAMGINFGVAVVTAQNTHLAGYRGHYCCSRYYELNDDGIPFAFPTPNERQKTVATDEFKKIPGSPVAYWVSAPIRSIFEREDNFSAVADVKQGLATADDQRFLRRWQEVGKEKIGFGFSSREEATESNSKWFPFNKGGEFRRWYGNQEFLVNWENDGAELMAFRPRSVIRNPRYYFCAGFTWNQTGSSTPSFRYVPSGFVFAHIGSMAFPHDQIRGNNGLGFLNSIVSQTLIGIISPTMGLEVGHVSKLPVNLQIGDLEATNELIHISSLDWNAYERSWDFKYLPVLKASADSAPTLECSYSAWVAQNLNTIAEMNHLEEESNRLFIDAYGLQEELNPEVPIEKITLTVNPAYRYGIKISEAEREVRFQSDTMAELVSYSIGCMMGRYSLDAPGLIYAHSGNEAFDAGSYVTFPADDDGIIPLTDQEWFADDATNRFREFVRVAWDEEHLQENLDFVAESLCLYAIKPKRGESSLETIRRYLSTQFYKDHLRTYKSRPIYWLFSSGKQKAFECLVYLHRYNEGTLARMRTEYVTPLTGKYAVHAEQLEQQIEGADSTAEANRLKKELTTLEKQLVELREFDAKLKHFADRRISFDLDDGVKVNYGKFGDLLADVKAITGEAPEKI
tara:strand:- start:7636 stop:11286 length:3651 start_codon:yes stop_codon:yes gene_type:complete